MVPPGRQTRTSSAAACSMVRREHHPDAGQHRVELSVAERQRLGIGLLPDQADTGGRGQSLTLRQQIGHQVGGHHVRAGERGGDGRVARAGGDVEHPGAGADPGWRPPVPAPAVPRLRRRWRRSRPAPTASGACSPVRDRRSSRVGAVMSVPPRFGPQLIVAPRPRHVDSAECEPAPIQHLYWPTPDNRGVIELPTGRCTMSSYGQFCPMAKAMDVLDERWTLLIVREMLLGSRHFNDLRRGVPKMSPALLSKRLKSLTRAGRHRTQRHRRPHVLHADRSAARNSPAWCRRSWSGAPAGSVNSARKTSTRTC